MVRLELAGLTGPLTRHRIDAYRSVEAKAYRDYSWRIGADELEGARDALFNYSEEALDQVEAANGSVTLSLPAGSVTLLRGKLTR